MQMNGKVVVVTGASMGIGEAIAKVFADAGASVVLLSRNVQRAEAARHRIGNTERTAATACDVCQGEEINRVVDQTVRQFGRIDVWVNNAGVGIRDSVVEVPPKAIRELFETNFFGAISGMQAAVPALRRAGGGTIINISSVAGHVVVPFMSLYCASKFAMNALGKGARLELKRDNINVLTVCPVTCRPTLAATWFPIAPGISVRKLFVASPSNGSPRPPITVTSEAGARWLFPGP